MRKKTDEGWGKLYRVTPKALAKVNLNCYEGRTLRAIEYKTIAFNKISDNIPVSQFEELTGLERRNMKRAINSLLRKNVIWRKGNEYGLCKRFLEFEGVSIETQEKGGVSIQSERVVYPEQKCVYPDTLIRSSHKNIKKKVLSNHQEEEKRKKNESGAHDIVAMLKGIEIKTNMNQ
jgi:phage replication O-like protein O